MKKEYEFNGYLSGDYESFCWDVEKQDYLKYSSEEELEFEKSVFHKGMYQLYPDIFFDDNQFSNSKKYKFKITIETEEIKND